MKHFLSLLSLMVLGTIMAIMSSACGNQAVASTTERHLHAKCLEVLTMQDAPEDYISLVESLTLGLPTDLDKAKAIYNWVCGNISYDTTHTIYHADECYAQRKGVCNAYCELYVHLLQCAGIESRIISGKAKVAEGVEGDDGHAWVAVTIDGREMLVDPTWGAGTVNDGVFVRNKHIWEWFDVDPRLMIFTHFPDNEADQHLNVPVSYDEFTALPMLLSEVITYKIDIGRLYSLARRGELQFPELYRNEYGRVVELLDIPFASSLQIGRSYTFRIKLLNPNIEVAIINNMTDTRLEKWRCEGDGIYSIDFMPYDTNGVCIACATSETTKWSVIAKYDVEEPTSDDWDILAQSYPLKHPDVRHTMNLNDIYVKEWHDAGVDDFRLAQLIRDAGTNAIPIIYPGFGQYFEFVDMPMTYTLRKGEKYTFSIYPRRDCEWVLVLVQDLDWSSSVPFRVWKEDDDGRLSMTIKPSKCGQLLLMYNTEDINYVSCMGYVVVDE